MAASIFLLLDLYLGAWWVLICALRKDLSAYLIKASLCGGVAGILAEWWYFTDYWRPPSLLGHGLGVAVEDFLFGFCMVGLGATLFNFVTRKKSTALLRRTENYFFFCFSGASCVSFFSPTILK